MAQGEEKVKIIPADIRAENNKLFVDGKNLFAELFDRSQREEVLVKQDSLTAGLPEEDLAPGHVIPASILTISGSS